MAEKPTQTQPQFDDATARLRSLIDPELLAITDKVQDVNSRMIPFTRDEELDRAFRSAILSLTAPLHGKPDKRRILAICGESGAGKSTAIAFHTRRHKELLPYRDEDNVLIKPLFIFDGPKPCTPRLVAIEGLSKLNIQVSERISSAEVWRKFRKHLKKLGIKMVVIDEAQNAIDGASIAEQTDIADAFKQLVQMDDWPITLVLAGVPPLADFMTRKQLRNRKTCVQFEPITSDSSGGLAMLADIVHRVIEDHAGLTIHESLMRTAEDLVVSTAKDSDPSVEEPQPEVLSPDFLGRLAHSGTNDLGTIIKTVREAVEIVLYAKREVVTIDDFIKAYEISSGCIEEENVFGAGRTEWSTINVEDAALRDADLKWREENRPKAKPRPAAKRIRGQ